MPALVLAPLLGGCSVPDAVNPVEWYRDLTGASKNDPGADAANTKNLEAGSQQDYPNLASVPAPPTRALSSEERDALTQKLIADRANAKYTDEELKAGPGPSVPPPPPEHPAPAAEHPADPAPQSSNSPPPRPAASAAPAAPQAKQIASQSPASPAAKPARSAAQPDTPAAQPDTLAAAAPAVSLTAPDPAAKAKPAEQTAEAAENQAEPRESSLETPAVRSLPQAETPQAPPPPPQLGGKPAASAAPAPAVTLASAESAPAGSGALAEIAFAPNSAKLSAADRQIIAGLAPEQRETGGKLRVVGHASGENSGQQLDRFQIALDRANVVAGALAKAGIPADRIFVETAESADGAGEDRADIFIAQ